MKRLVGLPGQTCSSYENDFAPSDFPNTMYVLCAVLYYNIHKKTAVALLIIVSFGEGHTRE